MPRKNRRRGVYRNFRRIKEWIRRNATTRRYRGSRTPIPPSTRVKVWERDGHKCRRCSRAYDDQFRLPTIHHMNGKNSDHRFDWDRDSPNNNLVGWCEPCQQEYHGKVPRKRRTGGQKSPPGSNPKPSE